MTVSEEERRCSKCASTDTYFKKRWQIKSPRSDNVVKIKQYGCKACRKTFKVYE